MNKPRNKPIDNAILNVNAFAVAAELLRPWLANKLYSATTKLDMIARTMNITRPVTKL